MYIEKGLYIKTEGDSFFGKLVDCCSKVGEPQTQRKRTLLLISAVKGRVVSSRRRKETPLFHDVRTPHRKTGSLHFCSVPQDFTQASPTLHHFSTISAATMLKKNCFFSVEYEGSESTVVCSRTTQTIIVFAGPLSSVSNTKDHYSARSLSFPPLQCSSLSLSSSSCSVPR